MTLREQDRTFHDDLTEIKNDVFSKMERDIVTVSATEYPDELYKLKKAVEEVYPESVDNDPDENSKNFSQDKLPDISKLITTGIIEDLVELLNDINDDKKSIIRQNLVNLSTRLRNHLVDDRTDFFGRRVVLYAELILQKINGLIELDGYPKAMFRNYEALYRNVLKNQGTEKSLLELERLMTVARSVIPLRIRVSSMATVAPKLANTQAVESE